MPVAELKTFWTPELIEQLTLSWAEGKSAATIKHEIGAVSRSAVIGKIHRLGLPTPASKRKRRSPRPLYSLTTPLQGINFNQIKRKRAAYSLPPLFLTDQIGPTLECKCGIFELENHSCRWPIWGPEPDAPRYYCGIPEANFKENKPYCQWHNALGHYQREMKDVAK